MKLIYEITNVQVEAFGEVAERLLTTGSYRLAPEEETPEEVAPEEETPEEVAPEEEAPTPTAKKASGKKTAKE
jgi:hypothetical protein